MWTLVSSKCLLKNTSFEALKCLGFKTVITSVDISYSNSANKHWTRMKISSAQVSSACSRLYDFTVGCYLKQMGLVAALA